MRHGAALGYDVDLLSVEKARALLGKQKHALKNIPALPWADAPVFYASLNEGSVTHLALRLLILTAVRSKPLRFMRYEDVENDVWTIPAELMKGRRGNAFGFCNDIDVIRADREYYRQKIVEQYGIEDAELKVASDGSTQASVDAYL